MKERILKICEELCCREIAFDEELIAAKVLDSLKIMELICSLEEEFGIEFQPEEITELENFSCVNRMVSVISRKNERREIKE